MRFLIRPLLVSLLVAGSLFFPLATQAKFVKPLPVHPGDKVSESVIKDYGVGNFFRQTEISDSIFRLMQGKSYPKNATIARTELRYLTCLHRDAEGRTFVGEIIVHKRIASKVLKIFRKLYDAAYPIERMVLIDNYGADDETSMRANNTSGFNFRMVAGTTVVSKHGYGLAIDINPLYNPYVKTRKDGSLFVQPACAKDYIDRTLNFEYKIQNGDLCHRLFVENGFTWGGAWTKLKDYQHFETK